MSKEEVKIFKKKKEFLKLINTINNPNKENIENIPTQKHSQHLDSAGQADFFQSQNDKSELSSTSPYEELESKKNLLRLKNMVSIYKSQSENMKQRQDALQTEILELKKFLWNEPALKGVSFGFNEGHSEVIKSTKKIIKQLFKPYFFSSR